MAKVISKLSIGLTGNSKGASGMFKKMLGEVKGFAGGVSSAGTTLKGLAKIASVVAGALTAITSVKGFELADQIENATIAMKAMTGSAGAAAAVVGGLKDLAGSSSLSFPELADSARKLLAVGISAKQINPILQSAGEIAAGTGVQIDTITESLVRAAAEGKVGTRELTEMGKQGVPITAALAAQMHVTKGAVAGLVESGRVGFDQLRDALGSLSAPGGKFAGIMEEQAATLGGSIHQLTTAVEMDAAELFETLSSSVDLRGMVAGVKSGLKEVTEILSSGIRVAVEYCRERWNEMKGVVVPVFEAVKQYLHTNMRQIGTTILGTMQGVLSIVKGVLTLVYDAFVGTVHAVVAAWGALAAGLRSVGLGPLMDAAGAKVRDFCQNSTDYLLTVGYMFQHMGDVLEMQALRIQLSMQQAGNAIKAAMGIAVDKTGEDALSKRLENASSKLGEGLSDYISQQKAQLQKAVGDLFGGKKQDMTFDAKLDPDSMSLGLTVKTKPELMRVGSGEAGLARYTAAHSMIHAIGTGKGSQLAKDVATATANATGNAKAVLPPPPIPPATKGEVKKSIDTAVAAVPKPAPAAPLNIHAGIHGALDNYESPLLANDPNKNKGLPSALGFGVRSSADLLAQASFAANQSSANHPLRTPEQAMKDLAQQNTLHAPPRPAPPGGPGKQGNEDLANMRQTLNQMLIYLRPFLQNNFTTVTF